MQALLGQTTPTIGEPDDGTNFGTNNEDKKKDREKDKKFFNNFRFRLHKRRTKLTVNRYVCHKLFKKKNNNNNNNKLRLLRQVNVFPIILF